MHPSQVIDCHADLLTRLETVPRFRQYTEAVFRADLDADERARPEHVDRNARAMLEATARHARAAYAYRVTVDMSVLVQHAAAQLADDDTFDRTLAPTGCGLVRFDRPLPLVDVRGRTMLISWILWGPIATTTGTTPVPATLVSMWNDSHTHPDGVALPDVGEEILRDIGRWSWVGAVWATEGREMGPALYEVPEAAKAEIRAEGDVPVDASTNPLRYVHALWLLLGQTVATVEEEVPDRAARRRAGRMGIPDQVSVIRLRRAEGAHRADGESLVEWSHRWVVRGHWRNQPCGEGRSETRRIWIAPHVKGPEGAPLVVTDKVYDLAR